MGKIFQIWFSSDLFLNLKKNKLQLLLKILDYLHTLESALVSGLASAGTYIFTLGPLPTNGLAMLTKMKANLGIMITASHNPFHDNGLNYLDGWYEIIDKIEKKLKI